MQAEDLSEFRAVTDEIGRGFNEKDAAGGAKTPE